MVLIGYAAATYSCCLIVLYYFLFATTTDFNLPYMSSLGGQKSIIATNTESNGTFSQVSRRHMNDST